MGEKSERCGQRRGSPVLPLKIKSVLNSFVNKFRVAVTQKFLLTGRAPTAENVDITELLRMIRTKRVLKGVSITFIALWALAAPALGQVVVDRAVATVNDGVRTELITYSDLLWQLALQPGVPLEPPRSEDLKAALRRQIDLRIFALEAERLPRAAPTDKEVQDKIAETLGFFPSTAEFERRLRTVGFESVKDDNFEAIISQRIAIEKFLDFRFRSFVVTTAEEEEEYYRDTWVPEFKRRNPSGIVPDLDRVRTDVARDLTEAKVEKSMEQFLEEAKRRVTVTILYEV